MGLGWSVEWQFPDDAILIGDSEEKLLRLVKEIEKCGIES